MGFFKKVGKFFSDAWDKIKSSFNTVGKGVDNWFTGVTGSALTPAQREANEFSAKQAELDYQRQVDFYEQFQSPSAMMAQYRDAGINPALMQNNSLQPSGVSGGAPGSVSPGGVGNPLDMITSVLGLVNSVKQTNADVDLKESQAGLNDATTGKVGKETEELGNRIRFQVEILSQSLDNMRAEFDKIRQDIEESKSRIRLQGSEVSKNLALTSVSTLEAAFLNSTFDDRVRLQGLTVRAQNLANRAQQFNNEYLSAKANRAAEYVDYEIKDMLGSYLFHSAQAAQIRQYVNVMNTPAYANGSGPSLLERLTNAQLGEVLEHTKVYKGQVVLQGQQQLLNKLDLAIKGKDYKYYEFNMITDFLTDVLDVGARFYSAFTFGSGLGKAAGNVSTLSLPGSRPYEDFLKRPPVPPGY